MFVLPQATITIANTGDSRAVLGLHISNLLAREKDIGGRKGSSLDLVGIVADGQGQLAGDEANSYAARRKQSRLKGLGQSAANLFVGKSSAIQASARRGSMKLATTNKVMRKSSNSAEPPLPPRGAIKRARDAHTHIKADEETMRKLPWLRFPVTAIPLSSDHTLWRGDERKRVRKIGARVLNMAQLEGHEVNTLANTLIPRSHVTSSSNILGACIPTSA
jgi:hypothetical protein